MRTTVWSRIIQYCSRDKSLSRSSHALLVAFLVRTRLQLGLNAFAFEVYCIWLCVQTRLQLHLNTFALDRIWLCVWTLSKHVQSVRCLWTVLYDDLPKHVFPSAESRNPGLQVHLNEPIRFWHPWLHMLLMLRAHSSLSAKKKTLLQQGQFLKSGVLVNTCPVHYSRGCGSNTEWKSALSGSLWMLRLVEARNI